jgi:hypothetical protein
MITFKEEHPSEEVGLWARDRTIRMRAGQLGFIKVKAKEGHELPGEVDEDKKKIEILTKQLAKIQSRQPAFKIEFVCLGKVLEVPKLMLKYSARRNFETSDIDALLAQEMAELKPFGDDAAVQSAPSSIFGSQFIIKSPLHEIHQDEKLRYNTEVNKYLSQLREYLSDELNPYFNRMALMVPIRLILSNVGTSVANKVLLRIKFPIGQLRIKALEFPAWPVKPVRPLAPFERLNSSILGDIAMPRYDFRPPDYTLAGPYDGSAKISSTSSGEVLVSYTFKDLAHHDKCYGDRVFLEFSNIEEVKNFQATYEITCRELVDKVTGVINFRVEARM